MELFSDFIGGAKFDEPIFICNVAVSAGASFWEYDSIAEELFAIPVRHDYLIRQGCYYVVAINEKNAIRKLNKQHNLEINGKK